MILDLCNLKYFISNFVTLKNERFLGLKLGIFLKEKLYFSILINNAMLFSAFIQLFTKKTRPIATT